VSSEVRAERSHSSDSSATMLRLAEASFKPAGHLSLSALLMRVATAEFLGTAAVAYATSFIYSQVVLESWPAASIYVPSALIIALLVLLVSVGFRHYVTLQIQPLHRYLWNGIGAVALAFSFFLSALFLLKMTDDYSRVTFFAQLVTVAITVLGARAISHARIQAAVASGRIEARRAVLIGDATRHARITRRLRDAGVRIVRALPLPDIAVDAAGTERHDPDRRQARRLIEICRQQRPDDIVILATAADLPVSTWLAETFSELPVSLHVVSVEAEDLLGSARLGELGALVTIQLLHPPLSVFHRCVKRAFDLAAAGIGLILLSPLFALVAIAIKLDSGGPVFFRQTRHGYNNESMRVFKFRSMTTAEDGDAFRQVRKGDPRVTRIGQLLRRTNIDELPQLINVLSGEMSIVGPRPHPIALNKMFEQHIAPLSRRHNVKPGITGWAQVNGFRGETDTLEKMQRRFECDLYYIDNWSFLLDLKIILMTLFSRSAYLNAM